jgi:adenine-specific DNA-methyltransferase
MVIRAQKPRKALNKAFLKVKPNRTEIEKFKINLIQLLERTNDTESEEFHKNLVSDFLKKTYYDPNHYINTKGRNDLVVHNGSNANSTVGVIIEAKKPTNRSEMVTKEKLNTKAFQELVLYYLRERITQKNIEVKYLIVTNINEWFIFDATIFDRYFAQNKDLVNQFNDFESGRLSDIKTDFFYKHVAEPAIADITSEIEFTYFNIQDYHKPLTNDLKSDDNKLIALFKLLSPEHLLKLPFANDSNSLDKRFYTELLHIIGLSETKQGGKKLIERNKEGERNSGSFLEDAIIQLESLDKIGRLPNPGQYGETHQERLFNVALELSITWINRILFLKLLEAQLLTYHKGDTSYTFLSTAKIRNYDDLNSLFFQVLARKHSERNDDVKRLFEKVPYLNSSLFEPTELEHTTLLISNLKDDKAIPVIPSTVLKSEQGKKRTGKLGTLQYLFEFLNAYDFSSEGSEEIQEENKSLINASVLGLIFEKINGYKDGSFFTPGFITMYMCRETIRRAVVQKFNETKNWDCKDLDDIYDKIDNRTEANEIVNSIKICDPAVGSGHFLVSALNEMIAIKHDLKILQDRDGRRLKEYNFEVVNDELIITDDDGQLFEYSPNNKESQRVQETLFHEKQTIIENCLFGVDINPNSVKICRLRLWIELLKNAYYKNETELETLPNIDINIKCGNSLVSRFALDADLGQTLKKSKWNIESYRLAVDTYRNAQTKDEKRSMERLITDIKSDFRSEISKNDPKVKRLQKLSGELVTLTTQTSLFDQTPKEKKDWKKKVDTLTLQIEKLETEIDEIKANKIFENAFEWRFEFPEVLNDEGDFVGFDVIIANPPYGITFSKNDKSHLKNNYPVSSEGKIDSFKLFYELSFRILNRGYYQAFIAPNTFLYNIQSKKLRYFLIGNTTIQNAIELRKNIFEDAPDVVTAVLVLKYAQSNNYHFPVKVALPDFNYTNIVDAQWLINQVIPIQSLLVDEEWKINLRRDFKLDGIINKMNLFPKLGDYFNLKQGTKPYGDKNKKAAEVLSKNKLNNQWEPAINGRNISQYHIDFENDYVKRSDELHSCLAVDIINNPKIYFQRMRKISLFPRIVAAYDNSGIHGLYTCSVIFPKDDVAISLKYLLAILNSHLVNIWYKNYDTDIEIKLASVKNIPIPIAPSLVQMELSKLVDELIDSKKDKSRYTTKRLTKQIDNIVYKLYNISDTEIDIIEATDSSPKSVSGGLLAGKTN